MGLIQRMLGFDQITAQLDRIEGRIEKMAISQEQFDQDLSALVTEIGNLETAVDALVASKPAADLTAEDQAVQTAAAGVAAELAKITPPAA